MVVRPCNKNCEDLFRAQSHASSEVLDRMTADRKIVNPNELVNRSTNQTWR